MKILLDENLDVRFKNRFDITAHQVFTIRDMNWLGIKNGELLKLIEDNYFDILIAVDKNLPYQQNINALPVMIIILNVKRNVLSRITAFYPDVLELISKPITKTVIVLNEP
jgi:hypothetical protein